MSISDNYQPIRQQGNGSTVDYDGNWKILSSAYIVVQLEDVTTGALTPQTLGVDFTLSFNDTGFTVTFNTAPTSDYYALISRDVSVDQTDPYKTSKGYQGTVLENGLDKLTAIAQDQREGLDRSLKFPIGSTAVGALPNPVDDLFIGWDSTTGTMKNSVKTITEVETAVDQIDSLVAGSGVLVSSDDTTLGFLDGKLVVGDAIEFTVNNAGGNESLTVGVEDRGVDYTKLPEVAEDRILGRAVGAGSGDTTALTPAQVSAIATEGGNSTQVLTDNEQTGATYTFVLTDASNTVVRGNSGSAQTFTVPPNSTTAFAVGSVIPVEQYGAGQVTIAEGSGVTVNTAETLKIKGQYSAVALRKIATDEWLLIGDLEAA